MINFSILILNKVIMKNLILYLTLIGFTCPLFAQITHLPEIEITAVNYKYLNAVDSEDLALDIKLLQEKVAFYDIKNSDLYSDEYDTYKVDFFIPDGTILAAYDKNGKLLRTIEKYNNIKIPKNILSAVSTRFPQWAIVKDVYKVNYHHQKGVFKEEYRIKLENGDKRMTVKIDANGAFM